MLLIYSLALIDRDPEGKARSCLALPAAPSTAGSTLRSGLAPPDSRAFPFWITHGKHGGPNNTGHLESQRAEPSSRAGPGGSRKKSRNKHVGEEKAGAESRQGLSVESKQT